jgi:glycosyltransferase involved in cell wall biosynthesis
VPDSALVSIIIPCYNQAHFLGEAIESGLAQSYPHFEIIVVDDGSSDNTAEIAAGYGVCCLQQRNQGLAAARNTGLRHSIGQYLVFLDADDRLLPNALKSNLEGLRTSPESAFIFGRHRLITADGTPGPTKPHLYTGRDHYGALLQGNHIGMHATVMYRRTLFDAVGGYNTSLRACEDYDLYLRIARRYPITCHDEVVAEYRHHGANISANIPLMLTTALDVLRRQRAHVKGDKHYERMYKRGVRGWTYYYTKQWIKRIYAQLKTQAWKQAIQTALALAHYSVPAILAPARRFLWQASQVVTARWQRLVRLPVGQIDFGTLRQVTPAGYGAERTTANSIERYYVERFLSQHVGDVRGQVLAIGDTFNTDQMANGQVQRDMLYLMADDSSLAHVGDIPSHSVDCIVLVQGLHYVYELEAMVRTLHRVLKPGGILLATVSGIGHIQQIQQTHGRYWAFTVSSAQRLFTSLFPTDSFEVEAKGNVLAATAFLQGLEAKVLRRNELDYTDLRYPLLITIRAVKPAIA